MSEGRWKLSVDQQGVTIASHRFQLPTAAPPTTKAGELSAADTITNGSIHLVGDPALSQRFTEMFTIPNQPSVSAA